MKKNYSNVNEIIKRLASQNKTISFAESCTGGRIAAAFTAISGASAVLNGSVISYSNDIKHKWLNVDEEILENFGAVSSECVIQMLEGITKLSDADYALAVSGIAGPTGGTKEKPVGTVYIGVQTPLKKEIFKCLFHGDRAQVQEQSTAFAIKKLEEVLGI